MNQVTYTGGAKRSEKLPHYRDISHTLLQRIGAAMAEGWQKYEQDLPVGAKNFKKGDRKFALDVFDHAIAHLYELKEQALDGLLGDPEPFVGEDHLGHLGANLVMIDFFQSKGLYTMEPDVFGTAEEPDVDNYLVVGNLPETQEQAEGVTARLKRILLGANA